MSFYERHVFTCVNERDGSDARGCCMERGGAEVAAWFKAEVKARGWTGRIRANRAGCLDVCEFGPAVVVYPEQVWYSPTTQEDVKAICDRHLAKGEIVTELLIPGLN